MSPRMDDENRPPPPIRKKSRRDPTEHPDRRPSLKGVTGVYLLHFDRPFGHAKHYMGCAEDIDRRLTRHEKGRGAKLMREVRKAGIGWQVVHVWPCKTKHDAEQREHQLKGYNVRQCPLCTWEKVAS